MTSGTSSFQHGVGHFDGVFAGHAVGWTYHGSDSCAVEIVTIDGRCVASGTADQRRPDVEATGLVPPGQCCGFRIPLPLLSAGDRTVLRAWPAGGDLLPGEATVAVDTDVWGHLDEAEAGVLSGWAAGANGDVVHVTVLLDGRAVATVAADQPRADLGSLGLGERHGFVVKLPPDLAEAGGTVSVVVAGTGLLLKGCPRVLPPQPTAAVAQVNRAFLERLLANFEAIAVADGPDRAAAMAHMALLVMDAADAGLNMPLDVFFDARYGLLLRLRALGCTDAADRAERSLMNALLKAGPDAAVRAESLCVLRLRTADGLKALREWLSGLPEGPGCSLAAARLLLRTTVLMGETLLPSFSDLRNAATEVLLEEADILLAHGAAEQAADLYRLALMRPDSTNKQVMD